MRYFRVMMAMAVTVLGLAGCLRQPDRVGVSVSARRAKADLLGLHIDRVVPMAGARAEWDLDKQLTAYLEVMAARGAASDQDPVIHGQVTGHLVSGELGLNYFPWPTRALGLELGLETNYAAYDIQGGWGPVQVELADKLLGVGLNLGLTGEVPLTRDRRWRFFWGAGYHLTETSADRARIDLDGWYGQVGLKISLDP